MKTTTLRIAVMALACSAVSGLALADVSGMNVKTYSKAVKYNPAQVQTTDGAQALYSKLQAAAQTVCSAGGMPRSHDRWAAIECAADALSRAVQDVNSPTLDAIHEHRRGSIEVMARR